VDKKYFTKDYYTSNNYHNYLTRHNKYEQTAEDILDVLVFAKLVIHDSIILDYGCAVGFLLEGLRKLQYFEPHNLYGFDISEWASGKARKKHLQVWSEFTNIKHEFDVIFFLDVLEHMYDHEIDKAFEHFSSDIIVAKIPCKEGDDTTFFLDVSRKDMTHINCKNREEWKNVLREKGYTEFIMLNTPTIYDNLGVMCFIAYKMPE